MPQNVIDQTYIDTERKSLISNAQQLDQAIQRFTTDRNATQGALLELDRIESYLKEPGTPTTPPAPAMPAPAAA